MSPIVSRTVDLGPGGQGSVSVGPVWIAGSVAVTGTISDITNHGRTVAIGSGPGGGSLLPSSAREIVEGTLIVSGSADARVRLFFDWD